MAFEVKATSGDAKVSKDILKKMIHGLVNDDDFSDLISSVSVAPESFKFDTVFIAKNVYKSDDDQISNLSSNASKFSEILTNSISIIITDDKSRKPTAKILDKFLSHIELSITQRDFILENLDERKRALIEIKDQRARIYGDFIAILGIFSALIFGLFGGFNQLSSIVSSSVQNGISKTLIFGSLISVTLIILIFLLIHSIGLLTEKKLMACGCDNTAECTHNFFKRYPIFSISVLFCSLTFLLGIISHIYIDKKLIGNLKIWDFKHWPFRSLGVDYQYFIIAVIMVCCLLVILRLSYRLLHSTAQRVEQ